MVVQSSCIFLCIQQALVMLLFCGLGFVSWVDLVYKFPFLVQPAKGVGG